MKKLFMDKNGNINSNFSLVIGLVGVGLIVSVFYFDINIYISVSFLIFGSLLIGFSGYATQSATLDLRTFTKDPLGWRNAKKSYEDKENAEDKA
jgi:hypothetical protein